MVEGRKLHFLTSGARTNDLVYHPLTDRPFDHRNALAIRPTVRASFPLPLPRSHSTTAFNNRSRSRSRVGKKKKRRKIIHRIESLFFFKPPYCALLDSSSDGAWYKHRECRFRSCSKLFESRVLSLWICESIHACKVKLILFCKMFNNDQERFVNSNNQVSVSIKFRKV